MGTCSRLETFEGLNWYNRNEFDHTLSLLGGSSREKNYEYLGNSIIPRLKVNRVFTLSREFCE